MIDPLRLIQAHGIARRDLLTKRTPEGHWTGELSTSAFATATAVSALALVERFCATDAAGNYADEAREARSSQLVVGGLRWLARHQNADGGWGDTDKSRSNIATTMLVRAAFHLTGVPCSQADVLDRAAEYVRQAGGTLALRRHYGQDQSLVVPILTNCALAGLVPWREVPAVPFERTCWSKNLVKLARLPASNCALSTRIAAGLAKFHFRPPLNPALRAVRRKMVEKSIRVLEHLQSESGGFLASIPFTSFVVMCLASLHLVDHPIVRRGVDFLAALVRPDGSWPIETSFATRITSLANVALVSTDTDSSSLDSVRWLLSRQHDSADSDAGGWGTDDRSGSPPNVFDTSAALLALDATWRTGARPVAPSIGDVEQRGVVWLLKSQDRDGGWPAYLGGSSALPFNGSAPELTAIALRALHACRPRLIDNMANAFGESRARTEFDLELVQALQKGLRFLERQQRPDGSWLPRGFGNQDQPHDENPVCGTALVLLAYRDLQLLHAPSAQRGLAWLIAHQNSDGGWGGRVERLAKNKTRCHSSVEETAMAVEALLADASLPRYQAAAEEGLDWLVRAVEAGRHVESSPVGFNFARISYYEKLYPQVFALSALAQAVAPLQPLSEVKTLAAEANPV